MAETTTFKFHLFLMIILSFFFFKNKTRTTFCWLAMKTDLFLSIFSKTKAKHVFLLLKMVKFNKIFSMLVLRKWFTALCRDIKCVWFPSIFGILKIVGMHRIWWMLEPNVAIPNFQILQERLSCLDSRHRSLYSATALRFVHRNLFQGWRENHSLSVAPGEFWVFSNLERCWDSAKPANSQRRKQNTFAINIFGKIEILSWFT